jgi:hypothetical protein
VKAKRTIWIPFALGSILGLLSFVSSAVDFLIPLGFSGGATGPQEIPLILSAALSGPLGLFIASLIHEIGIYFYIYRPQFSTDQMWSIAVLFTIADFAAHILTLLVTAYSYRFLYQRARNKAPFLVGWILIIAIYYFLLVLLQSALIRFVIPELPSFSTLFRDFLPEFQVVLIITMLILLVLPQRHHQPQWVQSRQTPDQNGGTPIGLLGDAP